jgi:ribonuclease HIII
MLTSVERIDDNEIKYMSDEDLAELMEQERSQMDCSKVHKDNYNRIIKEVRSRNKGR